jgi:YD repeat-containing protein
MNLSNTIAVASIAALLGLGIISDHSKAEEPENPPSFEQLQEVYQQEKLHWPAQGTVTSGFGKRWGKMHKGIDIAAPIGTPIVAAASGIVTQAKWNNGGYGNLVEIQHPDGSLTRYAHNSKLLIRVGQTVEQGQLIALMGSTGHSTGSHCHFEVHPAGQAAVNPIAYLVPVQPGDRQKLHFANR